MTGPRGVESPFASIRELTAAERRITDAMEAMKDELLEAIGASDRGHEATHKAMREIGNDRHRRIEDFMGADAIDEAKRTGMMAAGIYTVRFLRVVNEFRWLILGAFIAVGLLLGNLHISVAAQ